MFGAAPFSATSFSDEYEAPPTVWVIGVDGTFLLGTVTVNTTIITKFSAVGWREVVNQNLTATGGANSVEASVFPIGSSGQDVGGSGVVNTFEDAPGAP